MKLGNHLRISQASQFQEKLLPRPSINLQSTTHISISIIKHLSKSDATKDELSSRSKMQPNKKRTEISDKIGALLFVQIFFNIAVHDLKENNQLMLNYN